MAKDDNEHEEIFVSYAREDQAKAEKLVRLLERNGWSVYWDPILRSGTHWPQELEAKLRAVRCVIVLWSEASRTSRMVWEEANFGLSRSALAAVRLDEVAPPLGFQSIQTDDLATWNGERNHAGFARLSARVANLLQDGGAAPDRLNVAIADELVKQQPSASHYSVSDMNADKDCILTAVRGAEQKALEEISHGYDQLSDAHKVARLTLDDRAPLKHFAAAAVNFEVALALLNDRANVPLPARSDMPVFYFLKMELANALVFSQENPNVVPEAAMRIYEELAEKYSQDTAVFLRMGQAKLRSAKTRSELQSALRDLNKALTLAPFDDLVSDRHWVYFEAPLKVGVCFWRIAELPDISERKRIESIHLAVANTESVIQVQKPTGDELQFAKFSAIKALGNTLFFKSHLLRIGDATGGNEKEIRRYIQMLRGEEYRDIYEKQVRIIDSVMFAAATVGFWDVALEEAKRNLANFREISVHRALDAEEIEMRARAHETLYFAQKLSSSRGLGSWLQLGRG